MAKNPKVTQLSFDFTLRIDENRLIIDAEKAEDMVTAQEFGVRYARYRTVIIAIARKLARDNDDLVDDLCQEGAVCLWKLDFSKARTNPDSMARQAIKFRMIDYLRRNDLRRMESLDRRMESGDQLEQDICTGELRLCKGGKSRSTRLITQLQEDGTISDHT